MELESSIVEKCEEDVKQNKENDVLIVLTTGKQDRGVRATLAFGWACTALALGKKVSMYLTMEGTVWAMKESAMSVKVEGFESLQEYIKEFFDFGGELLVCAPCTEYYCSMPDNLKQKQSLLPEAKLSGLSTVVSMVKPHTKIITF